MDATIKNRLRSISIILVIILGVLLLLWGGGYLVVVGIFRSEAKAELEYFNRILPTNEVPLPYDIDDYKSIYKSNWYFDSLTDKVQEEKRYEDFWVHKKNYDILFCSNNNFYVRKDLTLYSEIEADTVKKIVFTDNEQKNWSKYSIEPNLSDTQLRQLSEIILSEEYDTKENIKEVSVFSDTNNTLITWYTFLYLKNSENVCYDGIYVSIDSWFCIVEASDSNLYFRDGNRNYKFIPQDIAAVIRQEYKKIM